MIEIGDVEYFPVLYTRVGRRGGGFALNVRRYLKRPIETRKRDLLRIVEPLTRQHADRVAIHRALDRAVRVFVDRLAQVDAGDLRDEQRMERCDIEFHDGPFLA